MLSGPAGVYDGGADNDTLIVPLTGALPTTLSVDGGGGTDTLYVTFPATNDQVTLSADDTNRATTDVTDDLWMDYQLRAPPRARPSTR